MPRSRNGSKKAFHPDVHESNAQQNQNWSGDAADVFHGETSSPRKSQNGEDVNRDGLADLACQFYTQKTGFERCDAKGILIGQTKDGLAH